MQQYTLFPSSYVLTVSQLTGYLRQVLEKDEVLQDLWIQGEISNLSQPASGHLYFTLKDAQAAIRCVMWRSSAARLPFKPRSGLAVEAHGGMGIYEVSGQVQFYVDAMKPAGEGALYQQYLQLKAKLEQEGLFDTASKRAIPEQPRVIGIVTSSTGAALQDMLDTIQRRYPIVQVVLSPTMVQGAEAPAKIVTALEKLNQQIQPDVILIGRGGGSIEDLWAFNDESVVRAVAASAAPVISGVGHETDFTLTDFAADLRAPTPTAAAELATPDKAELLNTIFESAHHLSTRLQTLLADRRWELSQSKNRLHLFSPKFRVDNYRQRLDETHMRLNHAIQTQIEKRHHALENKLQALRSLNPQAVLERGYAIITHIETGNIIRKASQTTPDDVVNIKVSRGSMKAQIKQINPGGKS